MGFIFNVIFDITLISNLRFILKILFFVSACVLFFYYIKPFKKKALYFGFYIISPLFIFSSYLIDRISGALLFSLFLFFFEGKNDVRFENDQIQIKSKFEYLLGTCCKYEVIEKKYFLFEKKLAEFKFEESLYFKNDDIKIEDKTLRLHLILKDYDIKDDRYIVKDTILHVLLK